ncbi:MAG: glycosyltransferase family 2 protein [Caldilineaceae bacterium]
MPQAHRLAQYGQVDAAPCDVHPKPFYSIIVPAYNEAAWLPQLLEALTAQQTDRPYEIIVVANNCTDQTAQIARARGARTIEYTNPGYGVAYARQVGLLHAQGELIATTDADAVMAPTWLATLCRPLLQNSTCAAVTGTVRHYAEEAHQQVAYLKTYDLLQNAMRRLKCSAGYLERVTLGTNMAFRREQALNVGGYQAHRVIGEDFAIGHALSRYGGVRFIAVETAAVYSSARRFAGKSLWNVLRHDLGGVDCLFLHICVLNALPFNRLSKEPSVVVAEFGCDSCRRLAYTARLRSLSL